MKPKLSALLLSLAALGLPLAAQRPERRPEAADAKEAPKGGKEEKPDALPAPVVTHHQLKGMAYTATAGYLPLVDAKGERDAKIFYTAYTADNAGGAARPLIFCFNGGPGSSSIWLHLGCIGPKRVQLMPDGQLPPPPFKLVDNADSWLDQADLVFIDPVGTGFSRAEKPELNRKFWNLRGDVASVGDFIRLYLTRNQRWTSPLFLAGESYGTTRASALSDYLVDRGVALNGVILISAIMNFQTAEFAHGNDLPPELFLPSYAATAWYHKKLSPELQQLPVKELVARAEAFAAGPYSAALWKGDTLTAEERGAIADQVAAFTGLSRTYVLQSNLRPVIFAFTNELLRDRNRLVGRLESRFTAMLPHGTAEASDLDPLLSAVTPPYTSAYNDYVRRELGFQSDDEYKVLSFEVGGQWNWDADNRSVDTSVDLREAFRKNPYMKLLVANGYYDLGTPFSATEYTVNHLGLEPEQHARIGLTYYETGHMIYIDDKARAQLRSDVRGFIQSAAGK